MKEKIYGLLGKTLGHSYSPAIHAAMGDYPYRLFEREVEDVPAFLASDEFEAINVTIPYKKTVLPFLAEISDEARKIGSVNTITRTPHGLRGDNTDYYGFSFLLDRGNVRVAGKKCLILGSGGASATALSVIRDRGGIPVVISRTGEDNYDNLHRHADAEVIINTTPVGMYPNNGNAPLRLDIFPGLCGVVDMIYNPCRTALILEAQQRGIPAISGLGMLVAQAKRANELFFARPLSDSVIDRVLTDVQRDMENIILIGMPGCGKSTAGREVAKRTGKRFLDTDEEILRLTGKTPAEIIQTDGEDAFRQIEHTAVCSLGKQSGCVIATGGGVVTRPENETPLRQNGTIVFLTRPIEELAVENRPLSARDGVAKLYETRLPLYSAFADVHVACSSDPEETARRILSAMP